MLRETGSEPQYLLMSEEAHARFQRLTYYYDVDGMRFGDLRPHMRVAEKLPFPPIRSIEVQLQKLTPAQERRKAETTWSELPQKTVDDITAKAKAAGAGTVRIFCFDEAKCGDLASNLENAFESARWKVDVRYTASMIPPGFLASDKVLQLLGSIDKSYGVSRDPEPDTVETITIGEKPAKGRLE